MKSAIYAAALAITLAVPVASFAQQADGQKTRAEVRAELAQLEASSSTASQQGDTGYGPGAHGTSQSGGSADMPPAPGKTQRNPLGVYFGN